MGSNPVSSTKFPFLLNFYGVKIVVLYLSFAPIIGVWPIGWALVLGTSLGRFDSCHSDQSRR